MSLLNMHGVMAVALLLLSSCSLTQSRSPLGERVQPLQIHSQTAASKVSTSASSVSRDVLSYDKPRRTLRLVSLNLAHGRLDSFHQLFVSAKQIKANLNKVADFLRGSNADLVALQEADGPSRWSGNFDHVQFLAQKAGFTHYVRSENVNNYLGDYGSGVLSQLPIIEGLGFIFQPSPPTSNKGFSLAQVQWQHPNRDEPIIIDLISVHLDFSRDSVRKAQIEEIKAILKPRKNSTIIMGDFNSEWLAREYMLEQFAEASPLHVYNPDRKSVV